MIVGGFSISTLITLKCIGAKTLAILTLGFIALPPLFIFFVFQYILCLAVRVFPSYDSPTFPDITVVKPSYRSSAFYAITICRFVFSDYHSLPPLFYYQTGRYPRFAVTSSSVALTSGLPSQEMLSLWWPALALSKSHQSRG